MVRLRVSYSFLLLEALVSSLSGRFARASSFIVVKQPMDDKLHEVPVHHPPGMGLPIAPNEDLNDDRASSGIPAHDVNV